MSEVKETISGLRFRKTGAGWRDGSSGGGGSVGGGGSA
jgi:hypothetical protein